MTKRFGVRQRKMSDEDICKLYEELKSSVDVAIRANTSDTTVLKLVREHGGTVYSRKGRNHVPKRLSDEEICRRYKAGWDGPRLAGAAGCGTSSIYNVLRRHGVERRPPGPRR
jgi:hypothetical protein